MATKKDEIKKLAYKSIEDTTKKQSTSPIARGITTIAGARNPLAPSIGVGSAIANRPVASNLQQSSIKTTPVTNTLKAQTPIKPIAPTAYQSSYSTQIDSLLNNIMNGKQFSYDMNADPMYEQYKNQYTKQGNMAMRDTTGNAAALTGGYGSSYGVTAGSQAYDNYLGQLNDKVPELYSLAYQKYQDDKTNQFNQLGALQNADNIGYSKYRDNVADYQTDRAFDYTKSYDAQQQGNWQDSFDYQQAYDKIQQTNYNSERDYNAAMDKWEQKYQMNADALAQSNYENEFTYKKSADELAQENYEKEVAYNKVMDAQAQANTNRAYNLSASKARSSGGSSSKSSSYSSDKAKAASTVASYTDKVINKFKIDKLTSYGTGVKENIFTWLTDQGLSSGEVKEICDNVGISTSDISKFYTAELREADKEKQKKVKTNPAVSNNRPASSYGN